MPNFTLSFVLVARNEEKCLARCLDSIMAVACEAQRSEIILVDSLSQDGTLAIARRYPIQIYQLLPEPCVSSWAARFIGLKYTHGELVQFLDGDMILKHNWLTQAAPYILHDESVVAVLGRLHEIYTATNGKITHTPDVLRIDETVHENPRWVGGAMLCHRERLQRLGAFNPFLYGEGEAEMCFRAELEHYKILALPIPMVEHFSAPRDSWAELRRKYRNKMFMGFGQALRYHCTNPRAYKLLLRRRNHALALGFLFLGVAALVAAFAFSALWPVRAWLILLLAYFAGLCVRYRNATRAFFNLATKALFLFGTVRGFFIKPRPVESFPRSARVITAPHADSRADDFHGATRKRVAPIIPQ